MIRRAILAAAAVAVLILPVTVILASVAIAHSPPSGGVSGPEDPKPAPGVFFQVHASGAEPIELVTLTMTREPAPVDSPGAPSLTRQADRRGEVDFDVTLTEDGVWTLVSRTSAGVVLSTQTVTVADKGRVLLADEGAATGSSDSEAEAAPEATAGAADAAGEPAAGTAPGSAAGGPEGGQLSGTGLPGTGLAIVGGVLVLVGAGLVLVARLRRPAMAPSTPNSP